MEEIYQRVVDLDKIDSKEMAYIAGYQTRVWWKGHYGYNRGMEYLSKNQIVLECPFKNHFHKSWLKFICENFKVDKNEVHYRQRAIDGWLKRGIKFEDIYGNEGYERACAEHVVYLSVTEQSKSHIGNKLPICKEEYKPYMYMGFLHSSGHLMTDGTLCFINSKAALKTFKKQLMQWYGFDDKKYFDDGFGTIRQIKDTPIYELIFSEDGIKKFFEILPCDYKEYFELCSSFPYLDK